jgi:hypothetical protein
VDAKKTILYDYSLFYFRNVARETSTTHFVFPSDIELYPSPNLIPPFLEMVRISPWKNVSVISLNRTLMQHIQKIQKSIGNSIPAFGFKKS